MFNSSPAPSPTDTYPFPALSATVLTRSQIGAIRFLTSRNDFDMSYARQEPTDRRKRRTGHPTRELAPRIHRDSTEGFAFLILIFVVAAYFGRLSQPLCCFFALDSNLIQKTGPNSERWKLPNLP